jgi:hypothetical protein
MLTFYPQYRIPLKDAKMRKVPGHSGLLVVHSAFFGPKIIFLIRIWLSFVLISTPDPVLGYFINMHISNLTLPLSLPREVPLSIENIVFNKMN